MGTFFARQVPSSSTTKSFVYLFIWNTKGTWPPCQFSLQVERRFHIRESNCQLLHLVSVGISPLSSSSLRSSWTQQLTFDMQREPLTHILLFNQSTQVLAFNSKTTQFFLISVDCHSKLCVAIMFHQGYQSLPSKWIFLFNDHVNICYSI